MPDARYDWLCEHYNPKSRVPANLTVYDIAGLTRGSSTGAGLGNAFLSHIRAVDAIFQVVRCFDDAEIIHVEGDVNPTRDLDIISEELRLKDIEFVEKAKENLSKQTRRGGQSLEMKKLKEEEATVDKILQMLKDGKDVRKGDWGPKEVSHSFPSFRFFYHDEQELCARHNPSSSTAVSLNLTLEAAMRGRPTLKIQFQHESELFCCCLCANSHNQIEVINPLFLLTAKPVVYLINLSEKDYVRQKNKYLPKVMEWIKTNSPGDSILPISVALESRLAIMEDKEAEEECKTLNTKSALPKVIVTMRQALNLASFFTTGTDEVRQWTIRKGTKAPQAAGVIHTDFEKTFIQCIVYNYNTLREYGDENATRAAGKVMTKGKDYGEYSGSI